MKRHVRNGSGRALRRPRGGKKHNYVLVLYVAGSTPLSMRAVQNIKSICDEHLAGRHRIDVIDLYRHPDRAASANIVAAPTLIKSSPLPVQRFVGDMSDRKSMIDRLRIRK